MTAVNDPTRYTVLFNTDGSANIKADCNQVNTTYTSDGSSISIAPGASTLAACPEDTLDQLYLGQLAAAAIYTFEGADLLIDLTADTGTMRFTPGTAAGVEPTPVPPVVDSPSGGADGVQFQLASFGPVGAQQPVLPGTNITAVFQDAQVAGSAGCNDYSATLTPVNDYFTIGPVASTAKSCSEPAGIMEQETAFLTALQGTAGYQWTQDAATGNVITAGQIFYLLADGTNGIMNLIAVQ